MSRSKKTKPPERWKHWRPNRRFLQTLWKAFHRDAFTLRQAYALYAQHHGQERADETFQQMNVRNTLSVCAYTSSLPPAERRAVLHTVHLVRVSRGVYRFKEEPTDE